jgi:hypothetical protein
MLVTTLIENQDAWHTQLGAIDFASSAIVRGLLVMPKVAVPSQQRAFRNHHSWEDDPAAREALGPIIAKWLAQGVPRALRLSATSSSPTLGSATASLLYLSS